MVNKKETNKAAIKLIQPNLQCTLINNLNDEHSHKRSFNHTNQRKLIFAQLLGGVLHEHNIICQSYNSFGFSNV